MAFDEKLADRVREIISLSHNKVEEKKMFGGLCFMVNDKMCVGVESNRLMIRFDPERTGELMEREGCSPMDFTNKVMKGFAFVDKNVLNTKVKLHYWVSLALEYNKIARPIKTEKEITFQANLLLQMKQALLLLFILPTVLFGQTRKDSNWLPLKPFIGQWTGEGGGEPGIGKYERSYQFILNKNFIEIKNKSTYKPTDKNPKGEVHEDIGYFSYEKSSRKFKLRQYHIESFVIDYVLDSISPDKKIIIFESVAIENIPKGYRAKETYRLLSNSEIEETFELAAPNKDYEVYSKVKLVRQN